MINIITQLDSDIERQISTQFTSLRNVGIVHVGHGLIIKNHIPTAIYTHKEWAFKYKEEKYYQRDPLRLYAIHTNFSNFSIIPWNSVMINGKKEREVLDERKRVCSSKSGVLIVYKSSKIIETFALGIDSYQTKISEIFSANVLTALNHVSYIHKCIYKESSGFIDL